MKKDEKEITIRSSAAEYLTYVAATGDNPEAIEVRYEDENIWLTQKMLATVYGIEPNTINYHIKKIYEDNELEENSTIRNFRIVQKEGTREVSRNVAHYNLQMIIAIGFKVDNERAIQFRKWANQIVKDYTIKGWVMDDERLKNGGSVLTEKYFEEQLERIREIRMSERKFYQKITDIYATSIDYDKTAKATIRFFKSVQNKLHYAVSGNTAAEIIYNRADYKKEHMGLTSWKGAPNSKIHKYDVVVAKNYLSETEIGQLERLQTDYIDVGMIHYIDNEEDYQNVFKGEIIQYVKQLKEEGKIKAIGLSSHNPIIAKKAAETGIVDVILFSINPCYDIQPASEDCNDLWDESNYENVEFKIDKDREEFYELCEKEEIAITVMKCYGGGDLLDKELSPFKVALTSVQCINYCLTRPGVSAVMLGVRGIDEIKEALKYETATKEEKDYGEILSKLPRNNMNGKCVYCGHCAPCTVGIDIASVNKYTALVKAEKEIPETVREHYKTLQHHAGECIKCSRCEKNCPFHVEIIQKMEEAVEIFGY